MDKSWVFDSTAAEYGVDALDTPVGEKAGTVEDIQNMQRLGKEQVFRRNFSFTSIMGFSLILMGTWETLLGTIAFGLGNGGPSGLIYTYIVIFIGFSLVYTSMAEMASMAPTSGGQYHWVSEFAPRRYQKPMSYFIGWLSVLGYQIGATIGGFICGTIIQGLIVLNYPGYLPHYKRWHGTLMAMAVTFFVAGFNILLAKFLPLVEVVILALHLLGWLAIVIPLWVMAPRTPDNLVWDSFVGGDAWGSTGLACLVGIVTAVGSFIGGDAPAHIAEETRSASNLLPRAMLWTVIANGILGLIMLITFAYTAGDISAALESPTGYPIIATFEQATGSVAGATGLSAVLVILGIVNNLTNMAGASRQLFAFARDSGVPFNAWISRVPQRHFVVPVNAVITTALIACVLHCINIGSAIAFNIILSVGSVALITSYITSISCIFYRRLMNQPLLPSHFKFGRMTGLIMNGLSLAFLVVIFIFCFFPPIPNPPPEVMNWACVVYSGVLLLALVYYLLRARHKYDGPVEYVRKTA